MFKKIIKFFKAPEYDTIERTHKARFLHMVLLVLSGASFLLGFLNITGDTNLDIILFFLGGVSFLCIPLNKRGYYLIVATFICTMMLVVITYSLIAGVGLKDAGLIAYPLFILCASYLFTKKAAFHATLISLASVVLVYYLGSSGFHIPPAAYSDALQLQVILILFPAAGLLLWAIVDNWERITKDLRDTYDLTLSGWGQALEYRDHETEGHSQRVVGVTVELAKRMGINSRKLNHIRRGALLHDIGKMAIPDSILLKKSGLTEDEWKVVRKHPIHARNMLQGIPYLQPALEIPYSHHERWDGSGYPQGLSKEEIPFAARIFTVVDVWDALNSERPYRPAWPEDKVIQYIRDMSEKHFDPRVVEAFLEYIHEKQAQAD